MVGTVALWMLLPLGVTVLGGWFATRRPPGIRLTSALQHFAAGIVIAAVCTEVVPEAIADREIWPVVIGFGIGVVLVILVRELSGEGAQRSGRSVEPESRSVSRSMLLSTAIDLLIDGLLVGLGFALARASGELLLIAVTFEVLFIAMSLAATMRTGGATIGRVLFVLIMLGILVAAGGIVGVWLLVDASRLFLSGLAAFATAALLYLVVEELMVEAHEQGETTSGTLMFFVGFLASLVLSMLLGSG